MGVLKDYYDRIEKISSFAFGFCSYMSQSLVLYDEGKVDVDFVISGLRKFLLEFEDIKKYDHIL